VTGIANLLAWQSEAARLHVSPAVATYIVRLARESRRLPQVTLGVSPRGTQALQRAAQALALLRGDAYVLPDHVKHLAGPVLAHRLLLTAEARQRGLEAAGVIRDLVGSVPVPVEADVALAAAPRESS
jgi:MoxR-like ATPase